MLTTPTGGDDIKGRNKGTIMSDTWTLLRVKLGKALMMTYFFRFAVGRMGDTKYII